MKKLFSYFFVLVAMITAQCVFVGCDKEDDDYYAGESEADYKPAVYTVTAQFDLSNVDGLDAAHKQQLKEELDKNVNVSEVFETRVAAIKAFDELVEELRKSDIGLPGLKTKLYLKRENAIIKSATITW